MDEKPDLLPTVKWIWEVFVTLDSSRQIGMSGPLPISPTDVASYFNIISLNDTEMREELYSFIRVLDPISLEDFYSKQKAKNK